MTAVEKGWYPPGQTADPQEEPDTPSIPDIHERTSDDIEQLTNATGCLE